MTGRKTKYTPETIKAICDALERGETQERAAELGGIDRATFYAWMNEKPDFSDAVKRAKAVFAEWERNEILKDAQKSLKTLICGLEYEETQTEYEQDPKNPGKPRIKRQRTTTKKILPNATAVIFALCNRDPEHWQNRVTNEIAGKLQTDADANISLASVPDDLLAKVIAAIRGED